MNNIDKTFYSLKYLDGNKPSIHGLKALADAEYGTFAIIEWLADIAYYCEVFENPEDPRPYEWVYEMLEKEYTDIENLSLVIEMIEDLYDHEDITESYKKEINDCYLNWIQIAEEMFND